MPCSPVRRREKKKRRKATVGSQFKDRRTRSKKGAGEEPSRLFRGVSAESGPGGGGTSDRYVASPSSCPPPQSMGGRHPIVGRRGKPLGERAHRTESEKKWRDPLSAGQGNRRREGNGLPRGGRVASNDDGDSL